MAKVAIIGSGNVGATLGFVLAARNVADIALIDIVEGVPEGKALDISQSLAILGSTVSVTGGNDYALAKGAEIVVITAGSPRKPGMTRDELAAINHRIVTNVAKQVARHAPESILVIVTNPLDAMTTTAQSVTGFPKERVMGMAGTLDTSRFRHFISKVSGHPARDVQCMVLGCHGDDMVPLTSAATVSSIPLETMLPAEDIATAVQRTRKGGAEIVNLLKTGSAFYAPAVSIMQLIEAILHDEKAILPVAAWLDGEYGISGVYLGVPAVLGKAGVEKVVELNLP
ncbi:malate dehydrogenase, partial [Candidatus Woesearchaeota archaeon CG_4_10_14_0_2_um_filter_57_5]